jgi:hypothetical protein
MNWQAAREDTLSLWRKIRADIGTASKLDLLTDINAVCALCVKAEGEADDPTRRCEVCPAFQQFGGCYGVNALMSERVVEQDWDGLRELVDGFIARLEALELLD